MYRKLTEDADPTVIVDAPVLVKFGIKQNISGALRELTAGLGVMA
jgi:hypothetical protein